ncbi:MAG: EthD family reductase [Gammaproteobacteria bacterium]|nr:MAG: EthD family reductase [Gammaproteobacteria bacterium]TLZ11598.1 MAG: EthD family reductase [Gammaproteobacteria bacterium]
MIIVSVLYPNGPKARFDVDYYTRKHMPMVQQRLGTPLRRVVVEQGIAGGAPGAPPPFLAAAHLYFDSLEAFQGAFGPHAGEIMADIPNYTSAQPVIQIGEVRV